MHKQHDLRHLCAKGNISKFFENTRPFLKLFPDHFWIAFQIIFEMLFQTIFEMISCSLECCEVHAGPTCGNKTPILKTPYQSPSTSHQKSLFSPGFEGHTELVGPHAFTWKTPTPPEDIRTKKCGFGFLFFPENKQKFHGSIPGFCLCVFLPHKEWPKKTHHINTFLPSTQSQDNLPRLLSLILLVPRWMEIGSRTVNANDAKLLRNSLPEVIF